MATKHFLPQSALSSLGLVAAFITLLYHFHRRCTSNRVVPLGIAWAGLRNERFAKIRLHLRDSFACSIHLKEGYEKFSRYGETFIAPNITFRPIVVLPYEQFQWLLEQPDSAVSIATVLKEAIQFPYTSPRSWSFKRSFHVEALNKMPLDRMTPDIVDEIAASIDSLWGTDTEDWRKVRVSSMSDAIIRITNRVFVGAELCKDDKFIKYLEGFVNKVAITAAIINNSIPKMLHPVLGPIVALPCRYYDWRCSRYLVPIIERHLRLCAEAEKTTPPTYEEPRDMLQGFSRYAMRSGEPIDRNARSICSRLLALNFGGVHSSTMTMINTLIDSLSLGAPRDCFASVRAEALSVLAAHGGVWSKAAVSQLVRIDSLFRESLRFSPNKLKGVDREIVARGGVTLPDGTHLPQHTRIALPTRSVHFDERFYHDPTTFDPWRFVGVEGAGLVATGDTFLSFGLGRHACPGRFFSAYQMKLLLAYIALNYDVQPLQERTPNTAFSDFSIPPDVELTIRRRKRGVK